MVEVAGNLHSLAVEQLEKLEQNSSNSSLPPSSDSFKSKEKLDTEVQQIHSETSENKPEQEVRDESKKSEKEAAKLIFIFFADY